MPFVPYSRGLLMHLRTPSLIFAKARLPCKVIASTHLCLLRFLYVAKSAWSWMILNRSTNNLSLQKIGKELVMLEWTTIINLLSTLQPIRKMKHSLMYALEEERIGIWNVVKKAIYRSWVFCCKIMKWFIISYNSVWLMCSCWWHISPPLALSYSEKKIGKPKEEIRNLNGFEYMYLSDLKVPYF